MNKSLAETVNFANAVKTKAYEKKAQQVDTFVQSETAEQKLSRSGKLQTAKAIEALAKMGGNLLDHKAKAREREVALLQEDLAQITASALHEKKPYESETFANLPIRMQIKVRNGVGYDKGKRAIEQAEASMTSYQLLDEVAKTNHLKSYYESLEVLTGMDAHEMLGYQNAWQKGQDRIETKALAARTADGEKKVATAFMSELSVIVATHHDEWYQDKIDGVYEGTTVDAQILQRQKVVQGAVAEMETHFSNFTHESGIEVPPDVLKILMRESLVKAATATGNPYFLKPDYYGTVNFQDETSRYFFVQAEQNLVEKLDAQGDRDIRNASAARAKEIYEAEDNVAEGTVTWDTKDLTTHEKAALRNHDSRGKLPASVSNSNRHLWKQALVESVEKGSGFLIGINGEVTTIPMVKQDLVRYFTRHKDLIDFDVKWVQDNLDDILVGIDTQKSYPSSIVSTYITDQVSRMSVTSQGSATVLHTALAKAKWDELYRAESVNHQPLNMKQERSVTNAFNEWLLKTPITGEEAPRVKPDLQGNTTPKDLSNWEQTDKPEEEAIDPNKPDLNQTELYFLHKDKPAFMKVYNSMGLAIPEGLPEELLFRNIAIIHNSINNSSLTQNKNTKEYQKAQAMLASVSDEELEAATVKYAEKAIAALEAQVPKLPYTGRGDAKEFIERLKKNPKTVFEDSGWQKYYD